MNNDTPEYALVAGVPATRIGWVGRAGRRLEESEPGLWICPETSERYRETPDGLALEEL